MSWDDELFPTTDAQVQQKAAALEFAKLYLVFDQDPRAKALLEQWVNAIEERDVAPAASHAEYAYYEGRRAFVRGVQRQLRLARESA